MEKASIFENLKCWQAARKLAMTVHAVSQTEKIEDKFFLKNLLKRSSVGAMSTIPEGFDRTSNKEFIRFLNSSKCAVAEVKCYIHLLHDLDYLTTEKVTDVVHHIANDTRSCAEDLISYLQSNS